MIILTYLNNKGTSFLRSIIDSIFSMVKGQRQLIDRWISKTTYLIYIWTEENIYKMQFLFNIQDICFNLLIFWLIIFIITYIITQ